MKVFLLSALVLAASAWQPGPKDQCNVDNVKGGTLLLPHEKYCQLFYSCDIKGNQKVSPCPSGQLFAYGIAVSTCVEAMTNKTEYSCPKWRCENQQDIGRKYPDVCCSKFWECIAIGKFTQRSCSPGTKFDMNGESCSLGARCENDRDCLEGRVDKGIDDCTNTPHPTDPCKYRTNGVVEDRLCPVGTSYEQARCQCSQFNAGCSASGLSAAQLHENKKPSATCQASGRTDFNSIKPTVFSEKLNRAVDHYWHMEQGVTIRAGEAVFTPTNALQQPYLYDYYYHDNTLYAPLAIVLTVRFNIPNFGASGREFNLLSNQWTTSQQNTHCNPATIFMSATYQGQTGGNLRWLFTIKAIGENGADSTGTAQIFGNTNDYFRVLFTFGVKNSGINAIGGQVSNRGSQANFPNNNNVQTFQTDGRGLGAALRPNKCGFALGRGLTGNIKEFNVHEGCSSFNALG